VTSSSQAIVMMQSHPEIIANCPEYLVKWPAWDNIAMNPTINSTYELVGSLISEVAQVFPSRFLHLGGDEVKASCWISDAQIRTYMQQNGYATEVNGTWHYDAPALQNSFEEKVQQMAVQSSKRVVFWEEVFTNGAQLDASTVVNVWLGTESLAAALAANQSVVMSYGWYLDRQAPTCNTNPNCVTNWMWEWTWHDMYLVEPLAGINASLVNTDLLLGGEASSWAESVDDTNAEERVWSRAPAVSERLWSNQAIRDINFAQPRLSSFHCKIRVCACTSHQLLC
jgi:hexosaminidase